MKMQFCQKSGLKKGKWSPEEDQQLRTYIKRYRIWNWEGVAKAAKLKRTGKSCRLRWVNYLKPDLKHGNFTEEEDEIIIEMYEAMGSKWSKIAAKLSGRSDNEIKNHWHTILSKPGNRNRHNKMKRNHRNKEKTSMTSCDDEDQLGASSSDFVITMEPNYFISFEPPFVSEQVQPLSVEDYNIEEPWNIVIADHSPSSTQLVNSSCSSSSSSSSSTTTKNQYEDEMGAYYKTTNQEQDDNKYWDTLIHNMISEEEFPQFERLLHEILNDWEFYMQV